MNDIIEMIFDLIQNMNPLVIFIQIPLIICAVCIGLMIILKLIDLVKWINSKQKAKN
ncbi:MAG: hypothetical protein IKE77_05670 [Erysipelotrichaceae bacterium]|nr:hypothetical protein [Erysipelotrichaceae bacterium]